MEIRAKILKITGEQCQSGGGLTGWYDWSPVTVRPGSPSYNIRSVERFSCTTAGLASQQSPAQVVGSKHCQNNKTRPDQTRPDQTRLELPLTLT